MTFEAGINLGLFGTSTVFLNLHVSHVRLFFLLAMAAVVALIALFILLTIIVSLCERQRLTGDVEPASEPYPFRPSRYWRATCEDALRLGLYHAGDFATKKNTSLVKGLQSLYLSQDHQVIASIGSGSFAGAKVNKTVLRSKLATGRVLESSDYAGTADFSGVIERAFLLNAGIAELMTFHVQRLLNSGSTSLPFNPNAVLAEYEKMDLERGARWVLLGLARWADPQQTSIRMTLRGTWAQLSQVSRQAGKLQNQQHRTHIHRAGSRISDS